MIISNSRHRLVLLMVIGLAGGCRPSGQPHSVEASASKSPPIRVTTIKPARKPLIRTVELPGRAEAFEVAPLFSKLTGYVTNVSVDLGHRIQGPSADQPGQPLCELLVPELKEELAEKTARVAQAQAEVLQSEAAVQVAQAAARSAAALVNEAQAAAAGAQARFERWQSEFQRVTQLAERGAVTQKVADETHEQFDAADAGRTEVAAHITSVEAAEEQAKAAIAKSQADVTATQARLEVARAEQRRVQAMLDYSVIRAPFDGIVVERNVHTGHLVQAGGGDAAAPLLTVMRIDPVRITVDVPEVDAVHIQPGASAEIRIPAMPAVATTGTVTRTSWALNATSRTLVAEIDVPNATGDWRPGQYVQIVLQVVRLEEAPSLPKAAIVSQDKQTFCFCVESDGLVSRRPISLGLQAGNDWEILSGLDGTEHVIGMNASSFREGQVVEIASP